MNKQVVVILSIVAVASIMPMGRWNPFRKIWQAINNLEDKVDQLNTSLTELQSMLKSQDYSQTWSIAGSMWMDESIINFTEGVTTEYDGTYGYVTVGPFPSQTMIFFDKPLVQPNTLNASENYVIHIARHWINVSHDTFDCDVQLRLSEVTSNNYVAIWGSDNHDGTIKLCSRNNVEGSNIILGHGFPTHLDLSFYIHGTNSVTVYWKVSYEDFTQWGTYVFPVGFNVANGISVKGVCGNIGEQYQLHVLNIEMKECL